MTSFLSVLAGFLRSLGAPVSGALIGLGQGSNFFLAMMAASGLCLRRPGLVVREMYFTGVLSLIIILVSGLFVGLVLGLQLYETLQRFGSGDSVGTVVALTMVRELGPVLAALLIASRAGSALTAEIGLMKATEQLSAMEMMAIQPMARVVAPRFWAGFLCVPLLTSIFNVVAIYGAFLVVVKGIGVDEGTFWSQMQSAVEFRVDIVNGIIKSFCFGAAIMLIAVYQGYHASPTAAGVSMATTQTVVRSALVILGLDFVLTAFMFTGALA